MTDLRIGVLGAARIARTKVIPALHHARNCRIVAVATQRPDAGERAALSSELAVPVIHGYERLLDDDAVDAVYIPLPNHLHAPWALAAVAAGKHVLCEKPLALDAAEARNVERTADAANVVLMEGFMYRFHPVWGQITEALASGAIGELVAVQSWFGYFNDDLGDIRNIRRFGGGALMDIGCYCVNLSRWLFGGEPITVAATSDRLVDGDGAQGVDTATSALLDFEHGQATFTCAMRVERDQGARLIGTSGRIEVPTPFGIPPDLPAGFDLVTGGNVRHYETPPANAFTLQFEAFADAVAAGGPAPMPPSDAVANMAVIDRILAESPQPGGAAR